VIEYYCTCITATIGTLRRGDSRCAGLPGRCRFPAEGRPAGTSGSDASRSRRPYVTTPPTKDDAKGYYGTYLPFELKVDFDHWSGIPDLAEPLTAHLATIVMALLLALAAAALLFLVYAIYPYFQGRKSKLPLPPGPPGEPILGHVRIVPTDNPEYAYAKWAKEYNSDVIYVNMLGQPVVVLNSVQAAVDLLDKRGSNYCDRPRFVLFEVMGWRATLTFLRWGPRFKLHRRVLQRAFAQTSCVAYRDLQEKETKTLLKGVLAKPQEWETILRRFATAIVMGIGFGVDIHSDNDPYIQ
jgi:hypothetical protein